MHERKKERDSSELSMRQLPGRSAPGQAGSARRDVRRPSPFSHRQKQTSPARVKLIGRQPPPPFWKIRFRGNPLAFLLPAGLGFLPPRFTTADEPKASDPAKADSLKGIASEINGYVFKFP